MKSLEKMPPWLSYFSLILGVFIAYSNLYHNEFLYDDVMLIVQNQLIRDWHFSLLTTSIMEGVDISSSFYRPLQIFFYTIIYKISGLSLFSFHLLNVFLHAANACLIYKLGQKLKFKPFPSFLAALLWAVHPMNCEAIAWISAVPEPLYVFFGLILLVYLLPEVSFKKCLLASPLLIFALLSKETAVLLPALVMCCLFFVNKKHHIFGTYLKTIPLWIVVSIYLVIRFTLLDISHSLPGDEIYTNHILVRFLTFLATLPSYLKLMLWPSGLHADYEFPIYTDFVDWHVICGAVILLAMASLIFYGKSVKNLPLRWACLWFLAAFSVYSGVLIPLNGRFMEHWMYLPATGLFLGLTECAFLYCEKKQFLLIKKTLICSYFAVIFIFINLTFLQNTMWQDEVTMYSNTLRYNPLSVRMHNNLGIAYSENGNYQKAIEEFRKTISISDQSILAHYNLALALLAAADDEPHRKEAISELLHTLDLNPNFYPAFGILAEEYRKQGDIKKADAYQKGADAFKQKGGLDIAPP